MKLSCAWGNSRKEMGAETEEVQMQEADAKRRIRIQSSGGREGSESGEDFWVRVCFVEDLG
jgi:hypothetical protein